MSLVDKLIWQIEYHLTDDLSLQMLADRCAVSAHHMCRVFWLTTGISVMSYVRARRLSVAADAIASQDADIQSVALDAGRVSRSVHSGLCQLSWRFAKYRSQGAINYISLACGAI